MHGPSGGYGSDVKERLRDWVWGHVGGEMDGVLHTGHVLLMPSVEGHEIKHLLRRLFTPDQFHVCDHNPAVVATLQRQFPGINTYGVSVERACQRIAQNGIKLRGAHLDFCGKLSRPIMRVISDCWDSGGLDSGWVFITTLRGREDPLDERLCVVPQDWTRSLAAEKEEEWWRSDDGSRPTKKDIWRIYALWQCLQSSESKTKGARSWTCARAYTSTNGQPFLTLTITPPDMDSFPEQKRAQPVAADPLSVAWEGAFGNVPGAPFPEIEPGEKFGPWHRGLTAEQRVRLAFVSSYSRVSEQTIFQWSRRTPVRMPPESAA